MIFKPINTHHDIPRDSLCMSGTRIAILDEIEGWCHRSEKSIYWLHGMGGLGKTAVAASLCQRLDGGSDRVLGGSFFCDCGDSNSAQRCMTTLVWSLAHVWEPFYDVLIHVLRANPHICSESIDKQTQTLLLHPLKIIRESPSTNKVFVIDALDESDDHASDSRTHIIQAINNLARLCLPWLKIVVTGRAETDIASCMGEIDDRFITTRDLGVVPGTEMDIMQFCEKIFGDLKQHFRQLTYLDPWPGQDIISRIAKKAGGSFLWVKIVHMLLISSSDPDVTIQSILAATEDDERSYKRLYQLCQQPIGLGVTHKTATVCF
jgi:hypothetical protein